MLRASKWGSGSCTFCFIGYVLHHDAVHSRSHALKVTMPRSRYWNLFVRVALCLFALWFGSFVYVVVREGWKLGFGVPNVVYFLKLAALFVGTAFVLSFVALLGDRGNR